MGGDHPPEELLAHLNAIQEPLELALIAPKPFPPLPQSHHTLTCIEADDVIGMDEEPLTAIRKKRRATTCVGMELVRDGKLTALVSTGNTGALLASAVHTLPLLEGIKRPGLLATLPTIKGPLALIDVGANLICTAEHLVSFAQLGVNHQKKMGIANPTIAILNIGEERYKGKPELIEAYQQLEEKFGTSFIGNIEGRDAFQGKADVLVTDGFTGNVLLKTAEGMASYVHQRIGDQFPALNHLVSDLDYTEHPGAVLAGVEGIVIKCHGCSDGDALINGIKGAVKLAGKG